MSVIMEFAIFPTDKKTSVSEYVAKVINYIRSSGYSYKLGSMGTTIETDKMSDALQVLEKSNEILLPFASRVYLTAKFDIINTSERRMDKKVESIENIIGEVEK